MWGILFEKKNEEFKQMNFSRDITKKIIQMRKVDNKILSFIDNCGVEDYFDVAIRFSKVYESLEAFVEKMEGKE